MNGNVMLETRHDSAWRSVASASGQLLELNWNAAATESITSPTRADARHHQLLLDALMTCRRTYDDGSMSIAGARTQLTTQSSSLGMHPTPPLNGAEQ